ncbi:hypothetical protein BTZ20_5609 [Rhodococcus sp. MTM3W5.2]|nr:hypothetical protein BTZ20_5609 [Rhodococcus sp. MTM3W5.2]
MYNESSKFPEHVPLHTAFCKFAYRAVGRLRTHSGDRQLE